MLSFEKQKKITVYAIFSDTGEMIQNYKKANIPNWNLLLLECYPFLILGKGNIYLCSDNIKQWTIVRVEVNVDDFDIFVEEAKPSEGCPRANGYYRHSDPRSCDKFFNCVDGTPIVLSCPPGLIYDDIEATCSWPKESNRKDCGTIKRGEQ